MRNCTQIGLSLMLAMAGITATGWSADKPSSTAAVDRRQVKPASGQASATESEVSQASFFNVRDSVVDRTELMEQSVSHGGRTVAYGLGRPFRHIREKSDCVHSWFYYIRGHGPAMWIRN